MAGRVTKSGLVFLRLKASDREATLGGLLWIAELRGLALGWVSHKFKAIYGEWPRAAGEEELPVQPSGDLLCWVGNERRKYRGQMVRKERKHRDEISAQSAAALSRVEAILAEIEANPLSHNAELREEEDAEALDMASLIEQRMAANLSGSR